MHELLFFIMINTISQPYQTMSMKSPLPLSLDDGIVHTHFPKNSNPTLLIESKHDINNHAEDCIEELGLEHWILRYDLQPPLMVLCKILSHGHIHLFPLCICPYREHERVLHIVGVDHD